VYITISVGSERKANAAFIGVAPRGANIPIGTARGIFPGRVTWAHNPEVTTWNESGSWWDDAYLDQTVTDEMVTQTVVSLAGNPNEAQAWNVIFRHFNLTHGRGDQGYQVSEKIVIKINQNNANSSHSDTSNINGTPQLILSLLKSLINGAGVAEDRITVFDSSRAITNNIYDKCHAVFPGVVFVDFLGGNGRVKSTYEANAMPYSANNGALATGIATCAVEATYMINMALMKGHGSQGVTFCAKNLYGAMSIDINYRLNAHNHFSPTSDGSPRYMTFTDFMGHKDLGEKTIIWMVDAIYGSEGVSGRPSHKWTMEPFNGHWPSSIFASLDGVALDSVSLDFFRSEFPDAQDMSYADQYLHESALANDPASGTFYDPEQDGSRLPSLGTHEHWNNATDKLYSRNLGIGSGIELVKVPHTNVPEGASARGDDPPDETADEAFDDDDQTKWLDFSPTGSWIQWRYPDSTAPTVKQYAITSANDIPARDPMDWNLLGSNDHGDTWDVLDSRTGEIFTSRHQKRSFFVSDPGNYNIYRLEITAVYDDTTANSVQLAELELLPCAGLADFNCNGTIGLDDFSYMAGVWLIDDPMADVADPAGQVDVYDMLVLAQEWLVDPSMDAAVAYWKLDETAGDLASDYSRNDHPGTLINMDDSDWVPGYAGNALDFDGVNDYVTTGDICTALAGRNVTVSAWMKAPALNPAMQFIIAINSSTGDNKLMFGTKANIPTLSFADSEPMWRDTTATVIDNTWHHIAFVLDDIDNTVTVYVDGSQALSFTSTVSIADTDLLSLGQEYDAGLTTGDFYTGLLDDVKVYDYALNKTQIRRLYDPSGLLAHWKLDETTGAVASDDSVYDHDGTLVNMDDSDWVPGIAGNALDFDGINDYVAADNVCAVMAGRDITVSAWIKAPAVNPANQFIISINSSNGDDNKLLMGTPAGTATLSLADPEPVWRHTSATVIDNTWHHVAYVIEDSTDTVTVYVDGSEVLSFASAVSIAVDDVFSLAQEYDAGMTTGDFYSGQLDDVRIYDWPLSQAEIATLAQ